MRIMHIKRTVRTWFDKFNDLFFKSTNQFQISNIIIKLIPLNNSEWKKRVFRIIVTGHTSNEFYLLPDTENLGSLVTKII